MPQSTTSLTEHDGYVRERYGQLKEGVHLGSHALNRAIGQFKWILDEDRWKQCGHDDINDFLATIDWSGFKLLADQRHDIVKALAAIQASQRQIARTLGVAKTTVQRDLAGPNGPPPDSDPNIVESTSYADTRSDGAGTDDENTEQTVETGGPNGPTSYSTIVIDPPWPMQFIQRKAHPTQVQMPYKVMQESEIAARGLPEAAEACHVWCWTTQKFLPMALRVLDVWGAKYICTVTWCKPGGFQPFGLPQYASEFVLYGRIGAPCFVETKQFKTWFSAPRGKHSEKPEAFYNLVRRVCQGPRADIFNRRPIDGFVGIGDEAHL